MWEFDSGIWASGTPSPSCAGLTRASMMRFGQHKTCVIHRLWRRLMDCRVKPGNDKRVVNAAALPLLQRHISARVGSVIKSEWTQQDVVFQLLQHLHHPAR